MLFLKQRRLEPEWMDDPHLDSRLHGAALQGLARINGISRAGPALWRTLRPYARALGGERPYRILDVASGGGDVALALWEAARREGVSLEVLGCDRSDQAVAFAAARAEAQNAPVRFFQHDALDGAMAPAAYDAVTCSLFLHHLSRGHAIHALQRMAGASRELVLAHDLRRSLVGLWAAAAAPRVLTRSPVVHKDAPISVRAAFTPSELRDVAEEAGLAGATVRNTWPFRQLLIWKRAA